MWNSVSGQVSASVSTSSPCLPTVCSGRTTSTITGTESSKCAVESCNSVERKPHTSAWSPRQAGRGVAKAVHPHRRQRSSRKRSRTVATYSYSRIGTGPRTASTREVPPHRAFRRLHADVKYKPRTVASPSNRLRRTTRLNNVFGRNVDSRTKRTARASGPSQKCECEVNADYNGAKNIGLRYARKRIHRLRSSPTSGSGDAGRRACEWWDGERGGLPAICRGLIAGSPHQSPTRRERAGYPAREPGGVVYVSRNTQTPAVPMRAKGITACRRSCGLKNSTSTIFVVKLAAIPRMTMPAA